MTSGPLNPNTESISDISAVCEPKNGFPSSELVAGSSSNAPKWKRLSPRGGATHERGQARRHSRPDFNPGGSTLVRSPSGHALPTSENRRVSACYQDRIEMALFGAEAGAVLARRCGWDQRGGAMTPKRGAAPASPGASAQNRASTTRPKDTGPSSGYSRSQRQAAQFLHSQSLRQERSGGVATADQVRELMNEIRSLRRLVTREQIP